MFWRRESGQLLPQKSCPGQDIIFIDGRIEQLMATGFLEGPVVVPCFVLEELQLISDSSDDEKRAKARRGLDALDQLQVA